VPHAPAARWSVPPWLSGLLVVLVLLLGWYAVAGFGGSTPGGGAVPSASSATAPRGAGSATRSATSQTPASGLPVIAESTLPTQARHTVALIRAGGPFPYSQDGVVFQNRERILPSRAGGYYHEYTVPKPGETTRGPWRIIVGGLGDMYWTADHYDSFRQVQEGR